MSVTSNPATLNPLPVSGLDEEADIGMELESEGGDVKDDISDLTFDRSAFDTGIYTQSPLQRDLEQQSLAQSLQEQGEPPHGEVELSERNVRRFGARRGYAPAITEESDSDSEPIVHDVRQRSRSQARRERERKRERRAPPDRREQMITSFTQRMEEASTFDSRFYNMSTLVLAAQIVVMALMIREGGIVPVTENVMLGPSVFVMLDFGAQQGGFVVLKHQWWRLGSAMFVHAGLVHLACNVYVQWQICGFLSSLWGRFSWLLIFFSSGVFGNVASVVTSPNQVGVGSSGGLMGVLAAWAVFILITWKLVPERQRSERNKQLCSLLVNIVIVVVIGQLQFVDGAAHLGGLVQGALLALFLLSDEQESINMKWLMRIFSLGALILLYIWVFCFLWPRVDPSADVLTEYE